MSKSKNVFKKVLHLSYGLGGAIVILGAMCKILHIDLGPISGGTMLGIGLGMEAIIFAISAFDFSDLGEETPEVTPVASFLETETVEYEGIELDSSILSALENNEVDLEAETQEIKENLMELSGNIKELSETYQNMIRSLKN